LLFDAGLDFDAELASGDGAGTSCARACKGANAARGEEFFLEVEDAMGYDKPRPTKKGGGRQGDKKKKIKYNLQECKFKKK
jgi:hypothetical protein